ncbi:hypothetical protein EMPG_15139, partial [Blastomyces silverae]
IKITVINSVSYIIISDIEVFILIFLVISISNIRVFINTVRESIREVRVCLTSCKLLFEINCLNIII